MAQWESMIEILAAPENTVDIAPGVPYQTWIFLQRRYLSLMLRFVQELSSTLDLKM